MNKTMIIVGGLVAVFAATAAAQQTAKPAVTGQKTPATVAQQARQTDEQAIRRLADTFAKAYNAGNAKAVAAMFVANGEIVNQAGESVQGQQAIERAFGEVFQTHPKSKIAVSVESVRLLAPTTAVEDGTSTVTSPSGRQIERNRYMVVHVKQDGTWRMATARDLPDQRAQAAEDLKELQWLIGDWVDESPGTIVTTSYRLADNDRSIVSDFHVQIDGQRAMTGTQRIGWDARAGKLHSWAYDSEGGFAEGIWTRNGNQWIVKTTGATRDGHVASSTNVISQVAKDRMTWQSRDRVIGEEVVPNIDPVVIVRKAPTPQQSASRN